MKKLPLLSNFNNKDKIFVSVIFLFNALWLVVFRAVPFRIGDKPLPAGFLTLFQYKHPQVPVINSSTTPQVLSESYILIDETTNKVLAAKNIDSRIYPASITKLATALTALNIYPLEEVATVNQEYKEGKVMDLVPGERMTIKSLVSSLLIYSANDAAYNLAAHYSDGTVGFVKQMNLLAQKYDLKGTHFTNFDGIHNSDHYSTVYDLSQLGRVSIKNQIVRGIVKTKELVVNDVDNKYSHHLTSTNELLGVIPEIEGLKTGWTPEAGGCFIGLININGHYLISVVAQSPDRFADTKQIINWAKANVSWQNYRI